MIIATAEKGGCGRIWPEDLNAGQQYFGILAENPFPWQDRRRGRGRRRRVREWAAGLFHADAAEDGVDGAEDGFLDFIGEGARLAVVDHAVDGFVAPFVEDAL